MKRLFLPILFMGFCVSAIAASKSPPQVPARVADVQKIQVVGKVAVEVSSPSETRFDPDRDCTKPYASQTVANLCIQKNIEATTLLAAGLNCVGLLATTFIAWLSYRTAKQSAAIAARAEGEKRAWLIPGSVDTSLSESEGDEAMIFLHIPIVNCGQTPALNVIATTQFGIFEYDPEHATDFTARPEQFDFSAVTADGKEFVFMSIHGEEAKNIIAETNRGFLLMSVKYYDVLGNTDPREFQVIFKIFNTRRNFGTDKIVAYPTRKPKII